MPTDDYISTLNISVLGALSFGEKKGLNCGYPTLTALFSEIGYWAWIKHKKSKSDSHLRIVFSFDGLVRVYVNMHWC